MSKLNDINEVEELSLNVAIRTLYEQPWNIVVNELGQIAIVCSPCTKALVNDPYGNPTLESLVLMSPVDIGLETAARCEKCGELGPLVSFWGDNISYGSKTVIFGSEPTRAPETWEQGSCGGHP